MPDKKLQNEKMTLKNDESYLRKDQKKNYFMKIQRFSLLNA